jgi:broad specificity phosphatase PhoE
MSTLTLLRHGQAAFGEENYDRLSTLGESQARATGDFFRERQWHFDRVLSGPRHRHRDTTALALGANHPVEVVDLLDEFAEGSQILQTAERLSGKPVFSGPDTSRRQRLKAYLETIDRWAAGEVAIDGAPAAGIFLAQLGEWLTALRADASSGRRYLAVTSAGVIAALVCRVLNLPAREIAALMGIMDNASLTTIVFSGSRLSLQSFNVSAHLSRSRLSAI